MESETRSREVGEQESKKPSEKLRRAKNVTVEALSEDEDIITVRAPIAKLLGNA